MWVFLLNILSKIPAVLTPLLVGVNPLAALGSLLSNIRKYWRFYLPLILVLLQVGTTYGWYRDHNLLMKEKAAHQQDIKDFKTAQTAANAQANAERAVLQKESKVNADQADAKYAVLLAEYRANLLRYKASQSGTQQTYHNQLPATQGSNGPSSGSEVPADTITITMDDAQVCAVNTARLQAVHDWALNPPKDGTEQ